MDNETLKLLCNIRSLRAAMRGLPMETQEKIQENVLLVVSDNQVSLKLQEEERLRKEQDRQVVLQKVNEMLAEKGLTLDEILTTSTSSASETPVKAKQKRQPRDPKYRWIQDGEEKTWTGQGKTPKYLAQQLEAGRSLDEFSIKTQG